MKGESGHVRGKLFSATGLSSREPPPLSRGVPAYAGREAVTHNLTNLVHEKLSQDGRLLKVLS